MNMWQNYIMVESLEEAVAALYEWGEEGRIIAGGTDLILEIQREMRPKIKTIIDVTKIPGLEEIYEDEIRCDLYRPAGHTPSRGGFRPDPKESLCSDPGQLGGGIAAAAQPWHSGRQPGDGIPR